MLSLQNTLYQQRTSKQNHFLLLVQLPQDLEVLSTRGTSDCTRHERRQALRRFKPESLPAGRRAMVYALLLRDFLTQGLKALWLLGVASSRSFYAGSSNYHSTLSSSKLFYKFCERALANLAMGINALFTHPNSRRSYTGSGAALWRVVHTAPACLN